MHIINVVILDFVLNENAENKTVTGLEKRFQLQKYITKVNIL